MINRSRRQELGCWSGCHKWMCRVQAVGTPLAFAPKVTKRRDMATSVSPGEGARKGGLTASR